MHGANLVDPGRKPLRRRISRRLVAGMTALAAVVAVAPPGIAAAAARPLFHFASPAEPAAAATPAGATLTEQRITLDLAALTDAPQLTLLDGRTYATARTGLERRGARDFTWRGKVLAPDGVTGTATLTVQDGWMAGRIVVPGGGAYVVVPAADGGHWLRALDSARSLPCEATPPPDLLPSLAAPASQPTVRVHNDTAMPTRVDLMVLYDAAALAGAGGTRQMRLLIQNAVDVANSSYVNSQVALRVALVHVAQIDFEESADLRDDVRRLAEDPAIADLRRRWGADLVSLVVETATAGNRVGHSYIMTRTEVSEAFAPYAYTVVRREVLATYLTLAHEMGHNMGCDHDPADAVSTPAESAFPDSFAHYVDGLFRTVMSYENPCPHGCPLVENFSNPDVAVAGRPTGIAGQRDNHRTLNNTRDLVASFMAPERCRPGPDRLCLLGGRFEVEVAWENQYDKTSGNGVALPRTDQSGFFAFGDPANVELLVKMLDFGGTIKLFYGELTDLKFALIVTDTTSGQVRYYANTPGDCGAVDPAAFPPAPAPARRRAAAVEAPARGPRGCGENGDALCLGDRFAVAVDWQNPGNGTSGTARPVALGSAISGAFYFTDPGNLELLVKVIDFGDRIAFFYGTLSDLDYTITVTDRASGRQKTYHNPAGHYCGGLDNTAF